MTMRSVNMLLPSFTYFRKTYYTPGYTGHLDSKQLIGLVVADVKNDILLGMSDYATKEPRLRRHYFMPNENSVNITDIIINWMDGKYNIDGVSRRQSALSARKAVTKDIIERCRGI